MAESLIYGYADPRSGELRYVGKSSSGMARASRVKAHRSGHCGSWIKSLAPLRPEVVVLEELADSATNADLNEAECHAIAYYRFLGARLTNLTLGGEGTRGHRGYKQTPEHVAKRVAAKRGKPHTLEARARMSLAHKGHKRSPESVTRQSAAQMGRKLSPETRAKISRANTGSVGPLGYKHTPEARARMSAAMVGNTNGKRK